MTTDELDGIKALMSEILNVQKLLVSGLGREIMEMFLSLLNVCFENADVHQTRNHPNSKFPNEKCITDKFWQLKMSDVLLKNYFMNLKKAQIQTLDRRH